MKWRHYIGPIILILIVAWACSGCRVSKETTYNYCFTKQACE